jgi:hypothetical protein
MPPRRPTLLPKVDETTEKRASCQYNSASAHNFAISEHNTANGIFVLDNKVGDLTFQDGETVNGLKFCLHRLSIELAISLRTRALHRWSFSAVKQPKLNTRSIGNTTHQTVERIHFANQMALAQTAYRRIAAHHPNSISTKCDQSSTSAHASGSRSRFATSVTTSHNNNIKRDLRTHFSLCNWWPGV